MYTLGGVICVANCIIAYEESQTNRGSNFLNRSVFFDFIGNLF